MQFLQRNFAKTAAQLLFFACGMLQGWGLGPADSLSLSLFRGWQPRQSWEFLNYKHQSSGSFFGSNKKLTKEKVFGKDIPQTSGSHSGGRRGSKTSDRPSKPWTNKHLGADIHDPNARMSMDLEGSKNILLRKTSSRNLLLQTSICSMRCRRGGGVRQKLTGRRL